MHILRAAGFACIQRKKIIEKLLDLLERQPSMTRCVQVDEESNVLGSDSTQLIIVGTFQAFIFHSHYHLILCSQT